MHSIGTFGRSGKKLAGQAIGFTHSLLNVSAHVVQNKLTNTEKEGAETMREWLVIEDSGAKMVFADDALRLNSVMGYIPRDVVEGELNIRVEPDGRHTWFRREDSEKMRAHPEWHTTEPPGVDPRERDALISAMHG